MQFPAKVLKTKLRHFLELVSVHHSMSMQRIIILSPLLVANIIVVETLPKHLRF